MTFSGWVIVPWKQIALKSCMRIDIRCNRNDASLRSSLAAVKRSPNSESNFSPLKLIGPITISDQATKNGKKIDPDTKTQNKNMSIM